MIKNKLKISVPGFLAGGISVTLNPEPMADFMDAFLIGEGEELLPEFFGVMKHSFKKGLDKGGWLKEAQLTVEGVYCPRFYDVRYTEDQSILDISPREDIFPVKVFAIWP